MLNTRDTAGALEWSHSKALTHPHPRAHVDAHGDPEKTLQQMDKNRSGSAEM